MQTKFPIQELIQALQDEEKGTKFYADRSEFIEKALTDTLTKEQLARLRELELQRLEEPALGGGPLGRPTAAGYPGVAEAIKLTAEQKKQLLAGEIPSEVLTAAQKELIAGMLGKPVKVATMFSGPGGGTPLPVLGARPQMLLNTLVWDDGKLSPQDQIAKLAPAANEYQLVVGLRRGPGGFGGGPGGGFPGGPGGGVPVDTKAISAGIEAFTKVVDAELSADQKKQLDQLAVQQQLTRGLETALLGTGTSEFVKAMALTDEQKKQLVALDTAMGKIAALL